MLILMRLRSGWIRNVITTLKQQGVWQEPALPQEYYFYHCNHLGLPDALTDQDGNIAWAAEYDPWGNLQSEHNPNQLKQAIRLPGQYHDPETGLYYNRHRYYDPALGSYISQDPIGLASGETNFYVYPTNPVQVADPLGLEWTALSTFTQAPGMQAALGRAMSPKPPSVRPDGMPWEYGCGDKRTDKMVPDRPLGYDFFPACRKHDICYGDSGSGASRSECDKAFLDDMMEERGSYKYLFGEPAPKVGRRDLDGNAMNNSPSFMGRTKEDCSIIAATYYIAVRLRGGQAYEKARSK